MIKSEVHFESKAPNLQPALIRGFLAQPENSADVSLGGVIVIHEIFGLSDHIKEVTCHLAEAGYTALGIDLFTREGAPPPITGGFQPLRDFVEKISDAQLMADLSAAGDYLRTLPYSNGRVGAVGFCYGGRVSMLLCASDPTINACVSYYGRVSGLHTANQPSYPIDVVASFHSPLLAHFGADDTAIPPAEANKLEAAMKESGKSGEVYVYEGAGHAFNNDTRESYNAGAAAEAWERTLGWLKNYL